MLLMQYSIQMCYACEIFLLSFIYLSSSVFLFYCAGYDSSSNVSVPVPHRIYLSPQFNLHFKQVHTYKLYIYMYVHATMYKLLCTMFSNVFCTFLFTWSIWARHGTLWSQKRMPYYILQYTCICTWTMYVYKWAGQRSFQHILKGEPGNEASVIL